ncbi:MAG: hypothetical protein ACRC7B_02590 [Metamycoplasmataceae bacterium]
MKKLLLGLGTISMAVLPVVGMVSCSTSETINELDITLFSDWTTVTEKAISDAIVQIKASMNNGSGSQSENVALINALNLVFRGVNSSNIDMFDIEYNEATPSVTLKGKLDDGVQNTFNGSASEDKKEITTVISPAPSKTIDISLKDTITQEAIDKLVDDYEILEDIDKLAESLNTVFNGFTPAILNVNPSNPGFYIQIISNNDEPKKIAILAGVDNKFLDDSTLLIATPRP